MLVFCMLKSYSFGIRGKLLSANQSFYKTDSLRSCVHTCINMLTGDFPIECSVSQGDPTLLTLLELYVNDLVDILHAV